MEIKQGDLLFSFGHANADGNIGVAAISCGQRNGSIIAVFEVKEQLLKESVNCTDVLYAELSKKLQANTNRVAN